MVVIRSLFDFFSQLSRIEKRLFILGVDVVLVLCSIAIAFSLRYGELYIPAYPIAVLWILAPALAIPVFIKFGLYRAIIRYIGFHALWAIFKAVSLYSLLWGATILLAGISGVPRSVVLINWVICIVLVGGSRMFGRWGLSKLLPGLDGNKLDKRRVLIYGAGSAGLQLSTALSFSDEFQPYCFVDHNKSLQNHQMAGLYVYPPESIDSLVTNHNIEEILLAIPSASHNRRREILLSLKSLPVKVRTFPGVSDIAKGKVTLDDVRSVEVADILGRDSIPPNPDLMESNNFAKVVLVTGAGGSIGSELCRQIISQQPKLLILYDHSEFNLYAIGRELGDYKDSCKTILGSLNDISRLEHICTTYQVNTIYHAAAYKHVPLVEENPVVGVENNIFGTWNLAKAAINTGVKTFVLISTDKAVRPTNVMGATKRFAELILQGLSEEAPKTNSTTFSMVRFGNVLDSSGSVVPLFREQIRERGVVTVTHPEITRYFMTIEEATQLVIQAGAMGSGGDVFVLDMGDPVNILDLATSMIRLSGMEVQDDKNPDGDVEIQFSGLRPGEKLYEELLIDGNSTATRHPRIMRARESRLPLVELKYALVLLNEAVTTNREAQIRKILRDVVKEYVPNDEKVIESDPVSDKVVSIRSSLAQKSASA